MPSKERRLWTGRSVIGILTLIVLTTTLAGEPIQPMKPDQTRLRRPIALAWDEARRELWVGNQRSGSLSLVDVEAGETIAEYDVAAELSDLQWDGKNRLLVLDRQRSQLLILKRSADRLKVWQRLDVPADPVQVLLHPSGDRCWVSSLWSRQLSLIRFDGEHRAARRVSTIALDFAPRCLAWDQHGDRLFVADAFGGTIATLAADDRLSLLATRQLDGHNIRGLRVSPSGGHLLVALQMLNELAHTVGNDVHWGLLMSNDLRWVAVDAITQPDADLYSGARMHPLGEAGSAMADPSALAVRADGLVVVASGGVDQVAVGRQQDFRLKRINVGRRPTALCLPSKGQLAFVANTFDDSISVVDLKAGRQQATISLGPKPELSQAELGELLFFDGKLSHDGWMSCHSCHTDGHTNGLRNDNFSDGSFGAPKRVRSLLGVRGTEPLAWNGGTHDLPTQVRKSLRHTMQMDDAPSDEDVAAIAAFVATLNPPPSLTRLRGQLDEPAVRRGQEVFRQQQCGNCHQPPGYTSRRTYDVGMNDELRNRQFNPPSLRGVGQRGPYFHDSRAASLESVFTDHAHQLEQPLSGGELRDLLAFLRSLE